MLSLCRYVSECFVFHYFHFILKINNEPIDKENKVKWKKVVDNAS